MCEPVYDCKVASTSSVNDGALMRSLSTLRQRRELRYSRDQQALSDAISHCRTGPSTQALQEQALERVLNQIRSRIVDEEQRLDEFMKGQADSVDDATSAALPIEKAVIEARLCSARSDEKIMADQLSNLQTARDTPSTRTADDDDLLQARPFRLNANLSLFLQKSPTKRPLFTYPSRPRYPSKRAVGPKERNSAPELELSQKLAVHSRAKSLIEDARLHLRKGQRAIPCQMDTEGTSDLGDECEDYRSLAVDEFTNSFSSRVITPSRTHKGQTGSLRRLRLSANGKVVKRRFESRSAPVKTDFGVVTILPQKRPRRRSELTGALQGVEMPSYVKNLMEELEETSNSSFLLELPDYHAFAVRYAAPFPPREKENSPVSNSPLLLSPKTPERSSPFPTKLAAPDFPRKQRSIFTLHLPRRSGPASGSRSTLVGSPTTSVSECTIDFSAPAPMLPAGMKEVKGLPSTRLYDLSQLERAPDDVPMTPATSDLKFQHPLTPRKGKLVAPLSALRDVKSRLAQFRRR